jgi:hypothetical protein
VGFWVKGCGSGVWGLWSAVLWDHLVKGVLLGMVGSGFRVLGSGFGVSGIVPRVSGVVLRV